MNRRQRANLAIHERINAEISARIKKDNELLATLTNVVADHQRVDVSITKDINHESSRISLQRTELDDHNRRIAKLERGGLNPQHYRRARVILNEVMSIQDALELGPIVYVIGELRDIYGIPLWLVIEAKDGAVPTVAARVRYE